MTSKIRNLVVAAGLVVTLCGSAFASKSTPKNVAVGTISSIDANHVVINQNVNGTDLFPRLCESLSETEIGVFLLGARPEVVEGVANWIGDQFPLVRVCGWQHG